MSAKHWADGWTRDDLLNEVEKLREAIVMADNRLETAAYKIGDEVETCEHCIELARSYLKSTWRQ
jgi:hypothetical protein